MPRHPLDSQLPSGYLAVARVADRNRFVMTSVHCNSNAHDFPFAAPLLKYYSLRMRETFLPFAGPLIEGAEIEEVMQTLKSGWITTGAKTHQFEEDFKRYVGAKYAIAVSSCTTALHLS